MKKFWMTLTAISLCTCPLCACSDDDKKDLLKNGEACTEDTQCASNYCDLDKCADEPTPYDCSTFEKMCEDSIALVSCDEKGVKSVDCSKNSDGNTECSQGECIAPGAKPVECIVHEDCAKVEGKPWCGNDKKCVAEKPILDECSACSEGVCKINICVTDAMTTEDASCITSDNDAFFCVDDIFWKCIGSKRVKEDCKAGGYGTCSRYRDPRDNSNGFVANCTGTDEMRAHCEGHEGNAILLCDPAGYDKYFCFKDARGDLMAVWAEDESAAVECANGCEYDGDGNPKCKDAN